MPDRSTHGRSRRETMDPNPYAPPNSYVEDVPLAEKLEPATRPRQIDWSFWLLITSLLLGLLNAAMTQIQSLVVPSVVLAALLGFAFAIRAGKNWARILFLILYLLGLPTLIFPQGLIAVGGLPYFVIFCCQAFLQGTALWFAFRKPGSAWFRRG